MEERNEKLKWKERANEEEGKEKWREREENGRSGEGEKREGLWSWNGGEGKKKEKQANKYSTIGACRHALTLSQGCESASLTVIRDLESLTSSFDTQSLP